MIINQIVLLFLVVQRFTLESTVQQIEICRAEIGEDRQRLI